MRFMFLITAVALLAFGSLIAITVYRDYKKDGKLPWAAEVPIGISVVFLIGSIVFALGGFGWLL